ncbi:hypothetical protein ACQRWP_16000 [Micromonospora trifolii]|uniref:hypothetical protein n=1 Tax=Micromonospora trifolii TaxID=2911208 RepID=UPI003D2F1A83
MSARPTRNSSFTSRISIKLLTVHQPEAVPHQNLVGHFRQRGAFAARVRRPAPGLSVTATTNGAVSFLAEALAVELGPIRVNAISPGVTDSGYWDSLGEAKAGFFAETAGARLA